MHLRQLIKTVQKLAGIKTSCVLLLFFFVQPNISAQQFAQKWAFKTQGRIIASPLVDSDVCYIGNEKGRFYAIDISTGKLIWKLETEGIIQAGATMNKNMIFFESANIYYAVDKKNGAIKWKFSLNAAPEKFTFKGRDFKYKLDFYDDKRASGIVSDNLVYFGTSNGKVIGLDTKNGKLKFSLDSKDNAPIRSTPLIIEGKLYFGDWNGIVYCYDLGEKKFIWQKNTYREKLYDTYGGIASKFTLHKNKVFFGARNHMLNVLWKNDGQKEWTYTDVDSGWIIGDPVIFKDTLYIGGSDNFSMLAFNADNGKLLWKNKRKRNIYTEAIVTNNWVIYTGGNSYNPKDTGEIVLIDRMTGKTISDFQTTSNVFSAPVLANSELVVFGSSDGTVYALNIKK